MRELFLIRLADDGKSTTGVLMVARSVLYTLEEPWKDNKRGISRIPAGTYTCLPHNWGPNYAKGLRQKDAYALQSVPGRSGILIHTGNTTDDIEGCILVGMKPGKLNGKTAVLQSREAMTLMRAFMGTQPFQLTIIDPAA